MHLPARIAATLLALAATAPVATASAQTKQTEPVTIDQSIEVGAWSRFRVIVKTDNEQFPIEITIRCVGRDTIDGKDALWIEFESTSPATATRPEILKFLVPTIRLREGPFGVEDIRHTWVLRRDAKQPVRVPNADRQGLELLFPGRLPKEAAFEKQTEELIWPKGTLNCRVLTFRNAGPLASHPATIEQTLLLHKSLPMGLAGFRWDINFNNTTVKLDGKLTSHGTGAEPTFPNGK